MRALRQGSADRALVLRGQGGEVRLSLHVLHDELMNVGPREGPLAREQFLVDNGQAVLVAKPAHQAVESLRRGIDWRYAPGYRGGPPLQILDHSPVGHFDLVVNEENVLRLNVEMLKLVLTIHQVQGFG